MDLKQISSTALTILRLIFWLGLTLVAVGIFLFLSAYGSSTSIVRLYVIPTIILIFGLFLTLPPGIVLLKIWLIKKQVNDIKEKGEKVVKAATFADKMYTKYTNKTKAP